MDRRTLIFAALFLALIFLAVMFGYRAGHDAALRDNAADRASAADAAQ